MPLILGIDPGVSGAFALIDSDTKELILVESVKSKVDFLAYNTIKDILATNDIEQAYMEDVGPMPWDSKQAIWTFASSVGAVDLALAWTSTPVIKIKPQKWQIKLGVAKRYDTKVLRKQAFWNYAVSQYPNAKIKLPQADAVLIAMYGVMDYNKETVWNKFSEEI